MENPIDVRYEELNLLDQELLEAKDQEKRCRQRKKILEHQSKELKRKERDHRLYTRGGMLEKFLREPLLLTNDHVFRILQESFSKESVRNLENSLISEVTEALMNKTESEETT